MSAAAFGSQGFAALRCSKGEVYSGAVRARGYYLAIAGDNHGGLWLSLWLTSNDYGLVHLVDGKIIEQASWQKLGGGPGSGLVPDPDGGVWTGLFSGGIAYFRAGQIRNLPLAATTGVGRQEGIGPFARSRRHALGRNRKRSQPDRNGRVATLTTANGLPCNTVHWIIEDDLSSYWLYTQCGLLRVARTELDAWAADPKRTIQATTFDAADGIRLIPILRGFQALSHEVDRRENLVREWGHGELHRSVPHRHQHAPSAGPHRADYR